MKKSTFWILTAVAAADLIDAAALSGSAIVVRITFPSGARRILRGTPSLPGESVALSAMATGSFSVDGTTPRMS